MLSSRGNHNDCKKGFTTHSHHSATNILIAGMFLLCHSAAFNVINQSNLLSALFGLSGQT
jgi:hypothetical protein